MINYDTVNRLMTTLGTVGKMLVKPLMNNRGEAGGEGEGGDGSGGGDGGSGTNWRDTLPENLKALPLFQKYNSPNDALAAFVDVQKLIGPEKIIMPSKDADDKEWHERVFKRLGLPEKPEGYTLPTDLNIPKELPVSEKAVQGFREQAHKLGILPKQFAGIYKWFMGEQIAQFNDHINSIKTSKESATTALRTEYGAAFDQNVALGEKVLNSFAPPETIDAIKSKGLNNDPAFIKFLVGVGKVLSEDQLVGKPRQLTMSPEEARAEINKMEGDLKGPLHNAQHPEHEAMMSKREQLYRLAYPQG
jgi:hypothetical protein